MFIIALACLLSWGALAFGAEYAWAYSPLLVFAVLTSVLGFRAGDHLAIRRPWIMAIVAAPVFAALLQVMPLPHDLVQSVSPASVRVDYQALFDKAMMNATPHVPRAKADWVEFSIAPARTALGVAFLVVLLLLFLACTRAFTRLAPLAVARVVLTLGVIVAFAELIQRLNVTEPLYGFWLPPTPKNYYSAPFINRNHTAGWLMMATALSAGYVAGLVGSSARAGRGLRDRVLRMAGPEATELMLAVVATLAMAIAVLATGSRSAFFALVLLVVFFVLFVARGQQGKTWHRAGGLLLVASMFGLALQYGGRGALDRLAVTNWITLDGRFHIWSDTSRIISDSPLVGTGLNTYGVAMLQYQTINDGQRYIEAHNDYLQLASEGGLLIGIPVVVAFLVFIREVVARFREPQDTRTYWLRAGAVGGLVAMLLQELGEFTLQMPGAAVLFVVLAAIAVHRPRLVLGADLSAQ